MSTAEQAASMGGVFGKISQSVLELTSKGQRDRRKRLPIPELDKDFIKEVYRWKHSLDRSKTESLYQKGDEACYMQPPAT